jgi:hypothetical protein
VDNIHCGAEIFWNKINCFDTVCIVCVWLYGYKGLVSKFLVQTEVPVPCIDVSHVGESCTQDISVDGTGTSILLVQKL